jgi:hypothetical protein
MGLEHCWTKCQGFIGSRNDTLAIDNLHLIVTDPGLLYVT